MRVALWAGAVRARLRYLALTGRPILIGPWRSELGFETLYWLPFLRRIITDAGIAADRLVTVSRGGAGVLYQTPAGIDLYQLRSPACVRQENAYDWQASHMLKQLHPTRWDREVLREAAAHVLGTGARYHVLHPSLMYQVLQPWWNERWGAAQLARWTDFARIPKPKRWDEHELPPKYVAMRWYGRATLPIQDPVVKEAIAALVQVVGAQTPIVLLTGPGHVDDHADLGIRHPSVVTLPPVPVERNLEQQLRVLAHATAFIGPYGGLAQTALRLGVPAIGLWKTWGGTAHAHLALSSLISKQTDVPFLTGGLQDVHLWRQALSVLVAPSESKSAGGA